MGDSLPAGQAMHAVPPVSSMYLPSSQSRQSAEPASGATVPGSHRLHDVEPSWLLVPAEHVEHDARTANAFSSCDENVPGAQAEQAPVVELKMAKPAAHRHAVRLDSEPMVPTPQCRQELRNDASGE